jgi:hypothetical protein
VEEGDTAEAMKLRHKFGALALGVASVLGVVAAPASAAVPDIAPQHRPEHLRNGGVYIVTPKWWGWCPDVRVKNYVTVVSLTNATYGSSSSDVGDDIGWIGVRLGYKNTIHVNVGCSLGHGSGGVTVTITPTRNGQAWFVGSTGGAWGN